MDDRAHPHAGDEMVARPDMVFDRSHTFAASPEAIWPWLVQLGKRRAGWYLPAWLERFVPRRRRAARTIDPRWQTLQDGDRIPDYGGADEELEVVLIQRPRLLVYRSERGSARFSWALRLDDAGPGSTRVSSRVRVSIASTGWRRRVIVTGGDVFDRATIELMFAGLGERLAV